MASNGYSQTMKFVEPDVVHRTRFAIAQDNGFGDKLALSLIKLRNNR